MINYCIALYLFALFNIFILIKILPFDDVNEILSIVKLRKSSL